MGVAKKLDQQINDYLGQLNPKQKKAVLTVVKTFAEEQLESDLWEDKEFVAEMNKRFEEMESGKVRLHTLEEAETYARQSYKNKKRKK
jgi:hypothetical protein